MKKMVWIVLFVVMYTSVFADEVKLSIKDVMKMVSKDNYNLKQARLEVSTAMAQKELVEKNKFPKVSLDVSATLMNEMKTKNSPMVFALPGLPPPNDVVTVPAYDMVTPDHLYKAELSVVQPLYLGGSIKNGLEAAGRLQKNKQDILIQAKQDVLFQVVALYFNAVRAKKAFAVEERISLLTKKNLEDIQVKYDAKAVTKYELIRAETDVLESEVAYNQAYSDVQNTKFELANVLHISPDFELVDSFAFTDIEQPQVEQEIAFALKNRYDIKSFESLLNAFDAQIRGVDSEYKPQVFIKASGGAQMPEMGLFGGDDKFGPTYQITLGAQWVIFDGFKQNTRKMTIENDKFKYKTQLAILSEKIKEDIRKACINLGQSKKLVEISMKAQEKSAEVYNLVSVGYQNQKNTQLELLDARLQMSKSYRDLVNATFRHELARIQLVYLTGRFSENIDPLAK